MAHGPVVAGAGHELDGVPRAGLRTALEGSSGIVSTELDTKALKLASTRAFSVRAPSIPPLAVLCFSIRILAHYFAVPDAGGTM